MSATEGNPRPQLDDFYLAQVVEQARDIVVITEAEPLDEPGPRIVYTNEAFTELTGYTAEEALGRSPRFLQKPGETDEATTTEIRGALENAFPFRGVILNFGKNGQPYWLEMSIIPLHDREGNVRYFAAIERDSTERTRRELEMYTKAHTDQLTGVMNRHGFESLVIPYWEEYGDGCVSVMSIDVDRFKDVNDELGHGAGDQLLRGIGDLLSRQIRTNDFVVRMGGDEFVLVLFGATLAQASTIAQRIQTECKKKLNQTVSIGVASSRTDRTTPLDLLTASDEAMYQAKAEGRDRFALAANTGC